MNKHLQIARGHDAQPKRTFVRGRDEDKGNQSTEAECLMCYNCGCGMPNNDMGNPKNITNKTFDEAAQAMSHSAKDAKRNAHELLERVLKAKEERQDKNWRP